MFTFANSAKTFAPWVLALEQESYLSYIKKDDKEDIANCRPISIIFRCNNNLFLNISYIILHNEHFRNLKTNQLLSKKELSYIHFLLYVT